MKWNEIRWEWGKKTNETQWRIPNIIILISVLYKRTLDRKLFIYHFHMLFRFNVTFYVYTHKKHDLFFLFSVHISLSSFSIYTTPHQPKQRHTFHLLNITNRAFLVLINIIDHQCVHVSIYTAHDCYIMLPDYC